MRYLPAIEEESDFPTAASLKEELPCPASVRWLVSSSRASVRDIVRGRDRRLLVIVGPCSIHDIFAACEYADLLAPLREKLSDVLEIVMRVYLEKPRTTVGWKGLVNDPWLDGSHDIAAGLRLGREVLIEVGRRGLPAASEFLDPLNAGYLEELITWGCIGARTSESQTHRELASGLPMPIGFKNRTDGNYVIAADAIVAAGRPHHVLRVNATGGLALQGTRGNADCHLILRGGKSGPNYDAATVSASSGHMAGRGLVPKVMVDCSHENAQKVPERQELVLDDVCRQLRGGAAGLLGVMVESFLEAGSQPLTSDLEKLTYGRSITDGCVDFATTERMLEKLADAAA